MQESSWVSILLFVLTLFQLIGLGVSGWVLIKIVSILERLSALNERMNAIPIDQINRTRHRIENAERALEGVHIHINAMDARLKTLEEHL